MGVGMAKSGSNLPVGLVEEPDGEGDGGGVEWTDVAVAWVLAMHRSDTEEWVTADNLPTGEKGANNVAVRFIFNAINISDSSHCKFVAI
jgi:hypothetical protein